MKRVLILLLLVVILTGCNIVRKELNDIDNIITNVLKQERGLVNTVSVGYKYYLPIGVTISNSSSYNEKLHYKGNYYYLYVDAVGYYHKITQSYTINEEAFYSKELEYNDKKGYIEINKIDDKYFVEVYYNYAKIEAYVRETKLEKSIINILYILDSIIFNDPIIELTIGRDELQLGEEKFILFKPKREEGTFLDYVKHYDVYEDEIILE